MLWCCGARERQRKDGTTNMKSPFVSVLEDIGPVCQKWLMHLHRFTTSISMVPPLPRRTGPGPESDLYDMFACCRYATFQLANLIAEARLLVLGDWEGRVPLGRWRTNWIALTEHAIDILMDGKQTEK